MKRTSSIITFLLGIAILHGQPDTTLVRELLSSARQYLQVNNLDSTNLLVKEIYTLYHDSQGLIDQSFVNTQLIEASMLEKQGQFEKALLVVSAGILAIDDLPNPDLATRSLLFHKKSHIENQLGNYSDALTSASKAYEVALQLDSTFHKITINALMSLSGAHFRLFHTQESIDYTLLALEMQEKLDTTDYGSTARLLNNLANRYKDLRRYDKALHYLNRALTLQKMHLVPDALDLAGTHYNIALNQQSKEQFIEAIEHYRQSARITSLYVQVHPYLAEDFQKIGDCQVAIGLLDSALYNYDRAMQIYRILGDRHVSEMALYSAYASLFSRQGNDEKAIGSMDKCLALAKEKLGSSHPKMAGYLSEKTLYLINLGRIPEAKKSVMKALAILGYRRYDFIPETANSKDHLYNALGYAGFAHFSAYLQNCDITELVEALGYYQHAIATLDLLRKDIQDESSKHLLSKQTIRLYDHAIEVAYLLWIDSQDDEYAKIALQLSEISRRSTVLESILSQQAGRFPGLPAEMWHRERTLLAKISEIEGGITGMQTHADQDASLRTLQNELFIVKERFFLFLDSLKQQHPAYHEHRYVSDVLNVEILQATLSSDQCIIEYFDGEKFIYAFSISSESLTIHRYVKGEVLQQNITQYLTHTSNTDSILEDPLRSLEKLQLASHGLFVGLLQSSLEGLKNGEVLIIPDGLEANLVFDIFTMDDPLLHGPGKESYLFTKYDISYAQSIAAWQVQNSNTVASVATFAGFAPNYQSFADNTAGVPDSESVAMIVRNGTIHLPGARREIFEIEKMISGRIFLDGEATERSFREQSAGYGILHLSAHAIVNDEFPALSKFLFTPSFDPDYDDQLTAAEICHLNLSTDLVVLSACHTGSGQTQRGEGVMSLGRAFAFAGVPATVQSLWQVPDQTTPTLMHYFYQGLKQGMKKHVALNFSRNSYLETNHIQEHRHPYYWAGFILYGDTEALTITSGVSWKIGLLICCLFLALTAYLLRDRFL